jgi:hypothetical protein
VHENRICSAISVCSIDDTYNRKIGNEIALGRAKTRPIQILEIVGDKNDKKNVFKQVKDAHQELHDGIIEEGLLLFVDAQSDQKRIKSIANAGLYRLLVH